MKIITWNVNGIRARHAQLQELIESEQPDVLCLQEIKAPPDKVPALLASPERYWSYWHGLGGYSGVAILVRREFAAGQPPCSHPAFDFEQRIVVAECGPVRVASVYVPNGGKDFPAKLQFLEALRGWLAETPGSNRSLVLCGDLNVALEDRDVHQKERKAGQIGTRPEERLLLTGMLATGLTDIGRTLDPDNDELFTWWAPWRNLRQRNIGWRIDYVLAGADLAPCARTAASRREFGTSDHAPVVVTFDTGASPASV
jgi:exodeoxyribonuclease-3